jgi:hypothetical protein
MSTNKSVLAAQRRRVGQEMAPNAPIRTPQPSINSAQMFNGQGRQMPMPGQRQPAQQQQQQQMYQQQQQMYQQQQQQQEAATSKLTVAQAITLITLRLGALESKMMEMPSSGISSELGDNIVAVDKGFMDSIMERLESLEKQTQTQLQTQTQTQVQSNGSVNQSIVADVTLLKQQFDPIKQATVQTKNAVVTLAKESKDTKQTIDGLRKELNETKDLLNSLQTMVIDNNSKLLNLSLSGDFVDMANVDESMQYLGEVEVEIEGQRQGQGEEEGLELEGDIESDVDNEIVGTNLKELIEKEINLDN